MHGVCTMPLSHPLAIIILISMGMCYTVSTAAGWLPLLLLRERITAGSKVAGTTNTHDARPQESQTEAAPSSGHDYAVRLTGLLSCQGGDAYVEGRAAVVTHVSSSRENCWHK